MRRSLLYARTLTLSRSRVWQHARAKTYSSVTASAHDRHLPGYTAEHHPELKRDAKFASVSEADVGYFTSILGKQGVLSSLNGSAQDEDLIVYNVDWMGKYRGQSRTVLRPKTSAQVSSILRHCNERGLAVSVQGGNTGLVGGSIPVFDEIVLNLSRMNSVINFDPVEGVLLCEAGCVLESLGDFLSEKGFMMPVDLGAKGSCHIGGNVATNAGGLRLLRYGSLHGSVLGVEAVLADGSFLSNLSGLRKDNTGLALDQLFIGSEGALGVITKVSILTPVKPQSVQVAVLAVPTFENVQKVFVQAKSRLGEILSAFEFWDASALRMTLANLDTLRHPFANETNTPFYILVETSGSNFEHDASKLSGFLESLMDSELVVDGVVAQDESQIKDFWAIRECIPEACSREGAVYKYDLSIPLKVFYQLVEEMRAHLADAGLYDGEHSPKAPVKSVIGYGHVGDGNIHLNIAANSYSPKVTDAIEPYIYEWTQKHSGSISAEHGLGLMKAPWLGYSKSALAIERMRQIKRLFDPKGILNPYKYLPPPSK